MPAPFDQALQIPSTLPIIFDEQYSHAWNFFPDPRVPEFDFPEPCGGTVDRNFLKSKMAAKTMLFANAPLVCLPCVARALC